MEYDKSFGAVWERAVFALNNGRCPFCYSILVFTGNSLKCLVPECQYEIGTDQVNQVDFLDATR